MNFFFKFFLFITIVLLSGCATHNLRPTMIKQDPSIYTKFFNKNIKLNFEKYKENYFSIWHQDRATKSLKEVGWIFNYLQKRELYGSNLTPLEDDFLIKMKKNVNFDEYESIDRNAITLQNLSIRALPTDRPVFFNPKKAGEGFPFDYLQNSSISQNKPIFVTHYSKDREWVHIESSFTYGWVKRDAIHFVSKEEQKDFESHKFAVVKKEGVALYDANNRYIGRTRFGMLFPILSKDEKNYELLLASSAVDGFMSTKLSKDVVQESNLVFNRNNIDLILTQLLKSKYGWGGMSGERDCSSTLRDFYAPFGLWLPRNSSMQAKVGKQFLLDSMSNKEKEQQIKKDAFPFRTLLYMHGHILLYAGVIDGKIIVFQNMWGIRTKKDGVSGRYIIGRALFTPLDFGTTLENYDKKSKLISKIKSFNILF